MTSNRFLVEKELHLNLKSMQDMFTSTRQHSALDLKGGDLDVHDCHPILLSGSSQTSKTLETIDIVAEKKPNLHTVDIVPDSRQPSPYPSDINATPRGWSDIQNTEMIPPHSFPANIQRHRSDDEGNGNLSVLMEAAQIDSCYQPRQVLAVKPIACFYVLPMLAGTRPNDGCYRALYLTQRTRQCLVDGIAKMCNVEPARVIRTLRIRRQDLIIYLDDESVRELPEGQDMAAQFHEIQSAAAPRREPGDELRDEETDDNFCTFEIVNSIVYELWLIF